MITSPPKRGEIMKIVVNVNERDEFIEFMDMLIGMDVCSKEAMRLKMLHEVFNFPCPMTLHNNMIQFGGDENIGITVDELKQKPVNFLLTN